MCSRKDYVAIAAAFKTAKLEIRQKENVKSVADLIDGVSYAAEFVADALAKDNARFDRGRFLMACAA